MFKNSDSGPPEHESLNDGPLSPIDILAGPARPSLPLPVAIGVVLASFFAPILFLSAGGPSPLLGLAIIALAAAGVIAAFGVAHARQRRRSDPHIRIRARICAEGITLFQAPAPVSGQFFPASQIANARLFKSSLVILTTASHPAPGRYAVRFGNAVTGHARIVVALAHLTQLSTSP